MRRLIRPAVGRDSLLVQMETDASPSSLTVKFFPARRWAGLLINGLESDRHPLRLCPPYAVACGRATAARQSVSAGAGVPPTERTRARERAHTDRPLVAVNPICSTYRTVSFARRGQLYPAGTSDKSGISLIRPPRPGDQSHFSQAIFCFAAHIVSCAVCGGTVAR